MVRLVLALCAALLLSAPAFAWTGSDSAWGPYSFVEGTITGVITDNNDAAPVIFINSLYPNYSPPAGQWMTINWAQFGVPADAKAAMVGGILIITHGYSQQTCHETITFAKPGSTINPGNYIFQTLEAAIGSGQRSTAFAVVPITGGQTWWMWRRGDVSEYPANAIQPYPAECGYAVNLSVQGYIR
jgi:hypothetical protein